jgi:hypothetical protein
LPKLKRLASGEDVIYLTIPLRCSAAQRPVVATPRWNCEMWLAEFAPASSVLRAVSACFYEG